MLQAFEWYLPSDGEHWNRLSSRAEEFASNGITALWIPPPSKGSTGMKSVGYDVYDLHDLGEFNAKNPGNEIRTKYGSKQQLTDCVTNLRSKNLDVYVDTVLNHRLGAEGTQTVRATPYFADNRQQVQGDAYDISAYTIFNYPERNNKYSAYKWDLGSFDSTDYNDREPDRINETVWLFDGKKFDDFVSLERGNYDYLLGADVDFQSMYVRDELTKWGKWIIEKETAGGMQGMRLDALKHISTWFWPPFLREVKRHARERCGVDNFFVVGEYVQYDVGTLMWYLDNTEHEMSLFDFPLLEKFHIYSTNGQGSDMRKLFDGTLLKNRPTETVTFCTNHDTVVGQSLARPVLDWFKPLAHAIMLLRLNGYPCVFLADVDGSEYYPYGSSTKIVMPSFKDQIYAMCRTRRDATFGTMHDYMDDFHIIGWTYDGIENGNKYKKASAIIMSAGPGGSKKMYVGNGLSFRDVLGNRGETVTSDSSGYATFACNGGSVSVYVEV